MRKPRHTSNAKRREQRDRADEAELLADDREDEVGVRLGKEEELLPPVADAESAQAAGADRDQRLHRLEPLPQRIGLGIQKREQPLAPIRGAEREVAAARESSASAKQRDVAPRRRRRRRSSRRRRGRASSRCRSRGRAGPVPRTARGRTPSGSSVVVSSLIRSSRRARNEARKRMIAGLANSDGCSWNHGSTIQRCVPLIGDWKSATIEPESDDAPARRR